MSCPGAVEHIELELAERLKQLKENNKLVEAQWLEQRTRYDMGDDPRVGLLHRHRKLFALPVGQGARGTAPTLFEYPPQNAW